jgi:hypothetical protein
MEEKSYLEKVEEGLQKFWIDYGRSKVIKGAHTEIQIDPKFFIQGELNPEVADLLISVYLSQTTHVDLQEGRVTIQENVLKINDRNGKPIAEITNKRIIKEFTERLGI